MKLKSKKATQYSGDYNASVLEQWKSCVEMADSNTEKRNTSNNVFITINSAILAVVTFSLDYKSMFLSVIGVSICFLWLRTIESYVQLSKIKYAIVNDMEKYLPMQPYTYEWYKLQKDKYVGLTKIEKVLPVIFMFIFVISFIWPLVAGVWPCIKIFVVNLFTIEG